MNHSIISTQISQKDLRFQPGGQPVSFEVKVINTSEQFATFQVKVLAAGVEATAGDYWYRLAPEVSAKTPPGDSTSFSMFGATTGRTRNLTPEARTIEYCHSAQN
jgi:hypothetical protein